MGGSYGYGTDDGWSWDDVTGMSRALLGGKPDQDDPVGPNVDDNDDPDGTEEYEAYVFIAVLMAMVCCCCCSCIMRRLQLLVDRNSLYQNALEAAHQE